MNKPNVIVHAPGSRKARRAEAAKAREAQVAKDQAALIAKRASMALDTIVIVIFRGGAHDVRLHNVAAPLPEGYSEARASIRERWNLPALRFTHAERLAAHIRESLDRNRDTSRTVGGFRRRA